MKVIFPFVEERARIVEKIKRPYVQVTLINNKNKVTQWMYMDSGADITLIPFSVGKFLGFELKKDEEIRRIGGIGGGKVPVVLRKVRMRIGTKELKTRIAWCLDEDVPLILGRLYVFDNFKITLDQKESVIIFEEKK